MESPAGSKENHEPCNPGFDLSKAMNSAAAAVRADPIPDSACLTPRNGKRKMPPPAPLLAALFGPDYQTMSPDPRLPPFNERMTGMHAGTTSALAAAAAAGGVGPSGLSLFNAVHGGGPAVSKLPEALRQKLPDSLRRSHASGGATTVAELAPGISAAADVCGATATVEDGGALPVAGVKAAPEHGRARTSSAAALGDVQAAILYAEAEHIMEFLQERRNLARLASEFDDRLRVLCDVFCNTSMPTKPSTAANVTTATAATGANTPIEHQLNPEPTGASGNPSTGVEGDSGGSEQPAKRRRRPPAKHEGFCTSDAAALGSEAPEAGPVEASTGKGSIAESKGKSQGPQGSIYEGVRLDSAAAADHTAALYCAINETLERLSSRKMYKSGATTLRASVDRALLMCSQLEAGTGIEGTMVLESVLNNPLPLAKFPWSRRHEALRLARLALHSLHHLFTAGLGDFNLEITFSRSCAFSPGTGCGAPATAATASHAAPLAGTVQDGNAATSPRAKDATPHTLTFSSPGRAAVPAAAVAAAGAAMAAQERAKLDIGIQTDSGSPVSGGDCDEAVEEQGAAPMDTDPPCANAPTSVVSTGAAVNGTHALSRSASCAMEGDAVLRKGEVTILRAAGAETATGDAQRAAAVVTHVHLQATPKQEHNVVATDDSGAGASNVRDTSPSLLHTLANAATGVPKTPDASQGHQPPLGSSPPAMAPSHTVARDSSSAPQINVSELFTQWPMPLSQAASVPDAGGTSAGGLGHASQSLPEASLSQVLSAIPEGVLAGANGTATVAGHAARSAPFSSGAFSGFAGFGALLPGQSTSMDPTGSGAFPKVEPLSRPGGPPLTVAAAVTTDELMNAFDEASELRLRALGAVGGALAAGRGGKRRRVDGGRTFHQSIGIGNVGKKGGSDTPGGVQVSMVALCNYILTHGGWEKMKSDREAKLELLKHFGWDHGLPAGKSAVFKEDKAIQSLTTQVREYFVKTGVFHVLGTNRLSADGTTTTSGALDNSPTDANFAPQQHMRCAPDLLGTPALHGMSAPVATGGAQHQQASGANQGAPSYSVPMQHRAYTDPTDQLPRSLAFSLANQGVLPVSCNTDPLPQRSAQDMQTRMSHHGSLGPSMLSASQSQLPAALPLPPQSLGGAPGASGGLPLAAESLQDRTAALHMRALMEAMHMMQTHGPESMAAQHACMIAQATGRLGPQAGMPGASGLDRHTAPMMSGDIDFMRQLASQMHAPNAPAPVATGGASTALPLAMNPQYHSAMQMAWAPSDAAAGAAPAPATSAAASTPVLASSAALQPAAGAPASPVAVIRSGGVLVAPSAILAPMGGQVSGCAGAPSCGATLSGGVAARGSSAGNQGGPANDVSVSSAGGSPEATMS